MCLYSLSTLDEVCWFLLRLVSLAPAMEQSVTEAKREKRVDPLAGEIWSGSTAGGLPSGKGGGSQRANGEPRVII